MKKENTTPVLRWPKLFEGWVHTGKDRDQAYDNGFAYKDTGHGWGNGTANDDTGDGWGDGHGERDGSGGGCI